MGSNKENKCKLCGWTGRTHLHHIIPLRDNGEDIEENIIELCPNHHSEASEDPLEFAKLNNIKGEKMSDKKLKELEEGSILMANYFQGEKIDKNKLIKICKNNNFDRLDFIAYMMGITKKSAEKYL